MSSFCPIVHIALLRAIPRNTHKMRTEMIGTSPRFNYLSTFQCLILSNTLDVLRKQVYG